MATASASEEGRALKVLHVNFNDGSGGAGRAAYRLHRAQRQIGIESQMLVARKSTTDPDVLPAPRWFRGRNLLADRLESWLLRQGRTGEDERSLNLLPSRLHRRINASDADVVNLHWIHLQMMSVGEVARIRKPVVWTLHDTWSFCGAEHYFSDRRYVTGYPGPGGRRRLPIDWDVWTWARKRRRWRAKMFHLVAPSRWMAERSRESALFAGAPTFIVGNPIDPDEFTPRDRREARRRLGLPEDKTLLVFGAHRTDDRRKGFDLLRGALELLSSTRSAKGVELAVFGDEGRRLGAPCPTHRLGYVADMPAVYAAADVFLAPSRIDNLPNTVAEAAACGVPTVAFRTGGLPDLVDHRRSGYLAEAFEVADFARGIAWVLKHREDLGRGARERALALAPERVARDYLAVYRRALADAQEAT